MNDQQTIPATERLYKLIHDCLDAYEMLSHQITVANLDYELDDDEMYTVFARLHDRFRALAPDYPGILPLETPDITETTEELVKRLTRSTDEHDTNN
jgi:hypothetical protein